MAVCAILYFKGYRVKWDVLDPLITKYSKTNAVQIYNFLFPILRNMQIANPTYIDPYR